MTRHVMLVAVGRITASPRMRKPEDLSAIGSSVLEVLRNLAVLLTASNSKVLPQAAASMKVARRTSIDV